MWGSSSQAHGTGCRNKAAHFWGPNHWRVTALARLVQLMHCKWHRNTNLSILAQKQKCLKVWILQTCTSNI